MMAAAAAAGAGGAAAPPEAPLCEYEQQRAERVKRNQQARPHTHAEQRIQMSLRKWTHTQRNECATR
jgi:hypothetical protein